MDTYDDVMKEALRMAKPSPLPWILFVAALVLAGATAFVLLRKLDGAQGEAAAATGKALDLQQQLASLRSSKAELETRLERLEAEKADLMALKNELSRDVQAKAEELTRLRGTFEQLQEKMKAEIAKGEIRLSQAGGRLKVDMVDKVLFDSGEAQISRRGEEVLARVGAVLAQVQDRQIQVAGHTDDSPISSRLVDRFPSNWELSTARATNVVRFLQDRAGLPGKRLVASGYGPYAPISSNKTASGRARNRRIEILLTPALEPAPARLEPKGEATAAPAPKAAPARKGPRK